MELDTRECGKTIFNMEEAMKAGLMVLYIMENIWQEKNTDEVPTVGMTAANMMAIGSKTKLKV